MLCTDLVLIFFENHQTLKKNIGFAGQDYDFRNQREQEFQKLVINSKHDAFWVDSLFQIELLI